jgi:nucleotide-binding universal stress UspA family protein
VTTSSTDGISRCRIKRILIAVDSSSESARAAAYIRYMAVSGVQIRIVSVADNPRALLPLEFLTDVEFEAARIELFRDASDAVAQAKAAFARGNGDIETDVIDLSRQGGYAANALIDAATSWKADLLVVGARQHHGISRWVEGTVSEFVTTQAPCSILVMPASYGAEIRESPRRILFALDGSPLSLDALRFGLQFVTPEAHLRAIYVVDRAVRLTDFMPIRVLEDAFVEEGKNALANAAAIFAHSPNPVETRLLRTKPTSDDVSRTIVREAARWHADLVVVGTHGRRGLARWLLGSVAARTARITHTPLLLARQTRNS